MTDLLYLAVAILLPLAPAYILFKGFESSGAGEGTILGFKIKLGGPIAAYFVVFLLVFSRYQMWHPTNKVWEVTGHITDDHGVAIQPLDLKDVSLSPQSLNLHADGGFDLTVTSDGDKFPTLEISHGEGYIPVSIPLKPEGSLVQNDYGSHLSIRKIVLQNRTLPAYSGSGVAPAPVPASQVRYEDHH